jgi:beta-galactosidase
MNAEVDFVDPSTTDFSAYKLIIVPALYAASDSEIQRLNDFAKSGGHLLYTFKSGFSDENVKVRSSTQPGMIADAAGVRYNQFTVPENVGLEGDPFGLGADNQVRWWMEFLEPKGAQVIARYRHPIWGKYAAITRNAYGKGEITYLGFMPSDKMADKILEEQVQRAGLWSEQQKLKFPAIVRSGTLHNGHQVHYLLNYSPDPVKAEYPFRDAHDLLSGKPYAHNGAITLSGWGVAILEED